MELVSPIAFVLVWLGVAGFIVYRFLTLGVRGAGLGAKVVEERLSFRAHSSGAVKSEVSVVRTARADAPIAVALVQRALLSVSASGANLTREQALTLAAWLREAARGR